MRRTFNLNIAARAERHAFAFRDGQLQLFNESRFVIIGDNFTLPFFDAKNLFRQRDLHVLFHGDLTGQTAALFRLAFADMGKFGRQDITAPSFTVTRHWPQEPPPPQAEDKKIPLLDSVFSSLSPAGVRICLSASLLISITTSPALTSFRRAARIEPRQHQHDQRKHHDAKNNFHTFRPYSCTPENDIKPSAIRPVVKVIPNPRRPAGTFAYFIFSRMPAIATIASIQPIPEPKPYTMDSGKL